MNSAAIVVLTCLLVLSAQAQQGTRTRKCKCAGTYPEKFNLKLIKGEPVIHKPSIFCPRTEIIIITKADSERCVNPHSPLGKLILANKKKQEEREALRMTTSSGQTATSRHHTTSKL
ncbi:interleukin-8-like [Parambassis ranga]|uniref:Interleukin-8-like n=1 Tax=Parambassis ranga TaxID=210632 RepID=A0A6P7J1M9_9TELE|nr:interleukin-8-like [Parambassis ranga]